ncbi:MAG: glycosyltransferase family 4 protein, partial [Methanobacteriota archaeon]
MNLLVLASEYLPIRGGAGAYLAELAKRAPGDFFLHVVTPNRGGRPQQHLSTDECDTLLRTNIDIHAVEASNLPLIGDPAFKLFVKASIKGLLSKLDIDIVHSSSTMPDLLAPPERFEIPFVTTVHSTIEDHYMALRELRNGPVKLSHHERLIRSLGPLLCVAEDHYYRKGRNFISVSKWGKMNLVNRKGVAPSRINVIHNGVDSNVFKPRARESTHEAFSQIAELEPPKVLVLSRLTSSKATPFLSAAMREVSKNVDVHFVLAGAGSHQVPKDTEDICTSVGTVSHNLTPHLYSLCDVFLLPSLYENFPISLLEAMASECGVVASNVGGIPEVIEDGLNGYLVPPRDPKAMASRIISMIEDPGSTRSMGRLARKTVIKDYSWDLAASR